jgi:DNA polymerase delta subunit 1
MQQVSSKLKTVKLAEDLGVVHKIDSTVPDDDYYESWYNVLVKLKKYRDNMERDDLTQVIKYQRYVDGLTEYSEIEILPPKILQVEKVGKKLEKRELDAFVIDVEPLSIGGQFYILLYTRDIGSDETYLVKVPYYDYFYIKLDNDKFTPFKVGKYVNGYCWYLEERDKENGVTCLTKHVLKTEVVTNLRSMYGYQESEGVFLKITTRDPQTTAALFRGLSKKHETMEFFEATATPVVNKFLTAYGISGCSAIHISNFTEEEENKVSTCDHSLVTCNIVPSDGEHIYQPKMFYYDIECLSYDINVFPTADTCPVIQISYMLCNGTEKVRQGVLCLEETPGYEWFETEAEMLWEFTRIIKEFNPDALAGFNSNNFDMPYILDRMQVLSITDLGAQLSRRKNFVVEYKKTIKSSKQFGSKAVVNYKIPGRVMMDFFEIIKGDPTKRLRSYSLKSICAEYLGDNNKEDLAYKEIPSLFKTIEGRQRIASYCMQDTVLLWELDQKMMLGVTCWGMTKVLGVTPDITLNRGLVHKLMSKLKQYTEKYLLLIPTFTEKQKPKFDGKYEGAFVLDPDVGYYNDPVVILDFASLYPSLMIGWNLSYDTIVLDSEWMEKNPDKYEVHCGIPFVKHNVRKGIVPLLEEEMAKQRKAAKKKMAMAKGKLNGYLKELRILKTFTKEEDIEAARLVEDDKFDDFIKQFETMEVSNDKTQEIDKLIVGANVEVAIYDSEQLANKIIMNSLYGMLGSPTATVPCVEIAKTITGLGRENLMAAKDYVEKNYCEITGRPHDQPAKVIYGDTDSIFILMPGISVADAISYGKELDKRVQADIFSQRSPMQMEYEKVYCPFAIITKKKYAGCKYEFDPTKSKVSFMGMAIVKRDSAMLCPEIMGKYFDFIFKYNEREKGLEYVKSKVADLFNNRMKLDDFIITKKIAKAEYTTTPGHISAWKRMVDRVGITEAPAIGERFEFIVTNRRKGDGMDSCIVDVPLVREKGFEQFQIDKNYYFDIFIYNPLYAVMKLIHGEDMANEALNPNNYARVDTVVAKKSNLLGFFGKTSMTRMVKKQK